MNPLIINTGMDETVEAKHALDLVGRELKRRGLRITIRHNGNEFEVTVKSWYSDAYHTTHAYAQTMTEAIIDAMNDHWHEHKQ
jgi:hypothetical protein